MSRVKSRTTEDAVMAGITYELSRLRVGRILHPQTLESMRLKSWLEEGGRKMVLELDAAVASWREERMLKVPANWWQHFKQRWFPDWALKRWPVLYEHYDALVFLPRVPVVHPEHAELEYPVWRQSR